MKWYLYFGFLSFCLYCKPSHSVDPILASSLPERIDFNFHIKPILADRCFSCHGPDQNALKANLQLHIASGALHTKLSSGQRAFVAGNIKASEAFQRIMSTDPNWQMPPPDFQRKLSAYEKALIAKWIEQGAEYKPHWAFIPPRKSDKPQLENQLWAKNFIDDFVLKRLEENNLEPREKASKEILLRRVTFDLIGLPPTIEQVDDFLADSSDKAFAQVVDRLLASPHFGERMALFWLDLARYADSNGYSQDGLRVMWPWRDWVIKAFNANMPYDQFIRWQLAGDKIPNASEEQKLATGFLRNHRINGEGGIIDEEYRVEYAADRTETAATVFLGLTLQCARCHDHKYDPISHEEYYQFFGFFNSVHESGISANDGNSGPEVILTPPEVKSRLNFIDEAIRKQQQKADLLANEVAADLYAEPNVDLKKGLLVDLSFDEKIKGGFNNLAGNNEIFNTRGSVELVKGKKGHAARFTAYDMISLRNKRLKFDRADPFSFSFYLKLDNDIPFISVLNHLGSTAVNNPGYEAAIKNGYPTIRLVHSLPANLIEVRCGQKLKSDTWEHLAITYDGSGSAAGIKWYVNGEESQVVVFDKLSQGMANGKKDLSIGGMIGYQTETAGHGLIDDLKIFDRSLSFIEIQRLVGHNERKMPEFLMADKKIHYLQHAAAQRQIFAEIKALRKEKFQMQDTLVSAMVMEDLPTPRATFVLDRGMYDAPVQRVHPSTPKAIAFPSIKEPADRLALAGWMVDPQHPLTARVAVNRIWQLFFGRGLVKTGEDFGNQGSLPSHPELLDWLALHFIETGWDIKSLIKLIVLSASYQQSSRVSEADRSTDPENILLSRGPSARLSAELIRDAALSASGLLVPKIGGPSVKPYQPAGLWSEKGEFSKLKNYHQDTGPKLYRRSLYTFWRRTSPPPSMTTFDAPTRDLCIVSRQVTNTPLQALVLFNDPQFVEASRVLAERVLLKNKSNPVGAITMAYRLLTGQHPSKQVSDLLEDLRHGEWQKFLSHPNLARQLLSVGEYPRVNSLKPAGVAAMTMVCSTIMSFDETLTKR